MLSCLYYTIARLPYYNKPRLQWINLPNVVGVCRKRPSRKLILQSLVRVSHQGWLACIWSHIVDRLCKLLHLHTHNSHALLLLMPRTLCAWMSTYMRDTGDTLPCWHDLILFCRIYNIVVWCQLSNSDQVNKWRRPPRAELRTRWSRSRVQSGPVRDEQGCCNYGKISRPARCSDGFIICTYVRHVHLHACMAVCDVRLDAWHCR